MLGGLSAKFDIKRDVVALSLARLGDAVGNSLLFVVIPLYVTRMPAPWFPLSETARVGILISVYGLFSAFAEPFSGSLIDRLGHSKRMVQLGLAVMAGTLLAYIPADRYAWLLILRCVQGIGLAITVPAALALMAQFTRARTRGRAMGFYSAMRMLGIALGPLVGGFVQVRFGFTATFLVGAGAMATTILFVQLWVRQPSRRETREPDDGGEKPGFFDRRIWSQGIIGSGVAMLAMASAFTMMATLEKQFDQMLKIDAFLFAIAFSSSTFSRLFCQVPLGWLSDRWGRKPLIISGLLLLAPTTALQGWVTELWQLIALRIAFGVGSAAVAAPAFALAADVSNAAGRGRQMSVTTLGFSLGMAVGPLLAGFLVGESFALPFLLAGALCGAAAWVVYRFTPETVRHGRTAGAARSA